MVGLDHCSSVSGSAFHHVGIDRPLGKEIHFSDLFRLFFKYVYEFRSDDLSLHLGICDPGELDVKPVLRVYSDEIELERTLRTEYRLYLISLVLAQKTVVHKDTGELFADSFGQKRCCH